MSMDSTSPPAQHFPPPPPGQHRAASTHPTGMLSSYICMCGVVENLVQVRMLHQIMIEGWNDLMVLNIFYIVNCINNCIEHCLYDLIS